MDSKRYYATVEDVPVLEHGLNIHSNKDEDITAPVCFIGQMEK